jgi:hypothetical protein
MIAPQVYRFVGVEPGSPLPNHVDGYNICYHFADSEPCCAKCANSIDVRLADEDDRQWTVTLARVHWEGPPEVCAHCDAEIESAYGEDDYDDSAGELSKEEAQQRAMS